MALTTIKRPDNEKALFGTGSDLSIFHDGTDNLIRAYNVPFRLQTNNNENAIVVNQDGSVELYYDNSKTFETVNGGVQVTGNLGIGVTPNRELHVKGLDAIVRLESTAATGRNVLEFYDPTGAKGYIGYPSTSNDHFTVGNSDNTDMWFSTNDTERMRITNGGIVRIPDNGKFTAGASDDLQIYHNGSHSYIDNSTGSLYIRNTGTNYILLQPKTGETSVECTANGSTNLYYDNGKKFETTSTGALVSGIIQAKQNSGNAAQTLLKLTNTDLTSADEVGQTADIEFEFTDNVGNSYKAAKIGAYKEKDWVGNADYDAGLKFYTINNSASFEDTYTEQLSIDEDGRLLIGTYRAWTDQGYYDDIVINNANTASGQAGGAGISILSGNNTWGGLLFGDGDDTDVAYIKYDHGENKFQIAANAAVRLRIDSDGIKFGTDSATANALYDYEEGTFTPTYYGSSTGASALMSTSTNTATYVKIGKLVYIRIRFILSDVNDRTGTFMIGNLPFPNSGNNGVTGNVRLNTLKSGGDGDGNCIAYLIDGGTTLTFQHSTNTGVANFDIATNLNDTSNGMITAVYEDWN